VELNEEDQAFADNYRLDDPMTAPKEIIDMDCGVITRENLVLNYFTV